MFFASSSPGVASEIPFGKIIFPLFWEASERKPESSTSKLALGSHQPPMPCEGVASDAKGERGARYSFRKICVTLSLNNGARLTASNFVSAGICFLQSYAPISSGTEGATSGAILGDGVLPFQLTTTL